MVADEMMTLKSLRSFRISFRRPRIKSMLRLRSCASSTMMTLYFDKKRSCLSSCKISASSAWRISIESGIPRRTGAGGPCSDVSGGSAVCGRPSPGASGVCAPEGVASASDGACAPGSACISFSGSVCAEVPFRSSFIFCSLQHHSTKF